jgi:hypothetical protein
MDDTINMTPMEREAALEVAIHGVLLTEYTQRWIYCLLTADPCASDLAQQVARAFGQMRALQDSLAIARGVSGRKPA